MKSDKNIFIKARYLAIGLLLILCYLPTLSLSDNHSEKTDDGYCVHSEDTQTYRNRDLKLAIKNVLYSQEVIKESSAQMNKDLETVKKMHMCDGFGFVSCMVYQQDNYNMNLSGIVELYDRVAENDNINIYTILTENSEFFPKSIFPDGRDPGGTMIWEGKELATYYYRYSVTSLLSDMHNADRKAGAAFGSGNILLSVLRNDLITKMLNVGNKIESIMLKTVISEVTKITKNKIKIMSEKRSKLERFLDQAKDDANSLIEVYNLDKVIDENEGDIVKLYQKIEDQTCSTKVHDLIIKVKNEVFFMKKELSKTLDALENLNKRELMAFEDMIGMSYYKLEQKFYNDLHSMQAYHKPALNMDDKDYSRLIGKIKEVI